MPLCSACKFVQNCASSRCPFDSDKYVFCTCGNRLGIKTNIEICKGNIWNISRQLLGHTVRSPYDDAPAQLIYNVLCLASNLLNQTGTMRSYSEIYSEALCLAACKEFGMNRLPKGRTADENASAEKCVKTSEFQRIISIVEETIKTHGDGGYVIFMNSPIDFSVDNSKLPDVLNERAVHGFDVIKTKRMTVVGVWRELVASLISDAMKKITEVIASTSSPAHKKELLDMQAAVVYRSFYMMSPVETQIYMHKPAEINMEDMACRMADAYLASGLIACPVKGATAAAGGAGG